MSVYRFEDLRVWQAAKRQCDRVGALLLRPAFQGDRELSRQINDASLSVMLNISEGFLRRRDKETSQFLRYAFASNGEVKSGYYAAEGRDYLSAAEIADLIELNEGIENASSLAGDARAGRITQKSRRGRATIRDQERKKD